MNENVKKALSTSCAAPGEGDAAEPEPRQSSAAFREFVHSVSHDLREPVRGIRHYAQFLKEDYASALGEPGRTRLDALIAMTARIDGQLDALRAVYEAGGAKLKLVVVDLHELARKVVAGQSTLLDARSTSVRIDRLPSVICDRQWTEVLLQKLLENALLFNQREPPLIEIGSREEPEGITLYVADNGIGIENRHLEEVFTMFRRLHPASAYGAGPGAGLTIARKIVERHGGRIWLESPAGAGTTVSFTLAAPTAALSSNAAKK